MSEQTGVIDSQTEQDLLKKWEALGISNDFIFSRVMQDVNLLGNLIRLILPDLHFTSLVVQPQKSIEEGMDIHGVRFDIFAKDDNGNAITIEMQVLNTGSMPRRMRFYHAMADTQMLEKGIVYSKLKDSFIIIIGLFDPYGFGLHRYTFTNLCHEKQGLEMGDGTTKIFLNAVGTADDVGGSLKEFLDYVAGKESDDTFVKKIDEAVKMAKANKQWRRDYMTLMMRDLENQEIGMQKGLEQGLEQGRIAERKAKIEELLKDGKSPEAIADFCKYPIDLVKEVQEKMIILQ